jgi:hypothetical protein
MITRAAPHAHVSGPTLSVRRAQRKTQCAGPDRLYEQRDHGTVTFSGEWQAAAGAHSTLSEHSGLARVLISSAPAGARPEPVDAVLLAVVVGGNDEYR